MVALISEKKEPDLAAGRQATRSGTDIVPQVIRDAGAQAVESYLCFLAKEYHGSAAVYRNAARHFFRWCCEGDVDLDAVRAGHVQAYLEEKAEAWKPSTLLSAFHSLKKLFAHLDADRVVERTPFIGLEAPKVQRPRKPAVTLDEMKVIARELDNYDEDSEAFRATLVVLYPMTVGGMDTKRIAAFTGVPLAEVDRCASNLRESGIWRPDGKIALESDPASDEAAFEIILHVMCAMGTIMRTESPSS